MTVWQESAACRGATDKDAFYSDDLSVQQWAANTYCRCCPVKRECLARAEPWGVWGGLTPKQRAGRKPYRRERAG